MRNIIIVIKAKPVASPAMTGRVKILSFVGGGGGDGEVVVIGIVEIASVAPGDKVT